MYTLSQIAINNPYEFSVLLQKYQLPAADNANEAITALDYALNNYGNNFAFDLQNIEIQKMAVAETEKTYKNQLDSSNKEQLKEEIVKWNAKLNYAQDIQTREYILDKVAYIQKLIINKTENNSPKSFSQIHKNNQLLLLVLTTIALMFIGSKIIKQ